MEDPKKDAEDVEVSDASNDMSSPALIATVEEKLAAIRDENVGGSEKSDTTVDESSTTTKVEEDPTVDATTDDQTTNTDDTTTGAEDDESPTLPAGYRRAALARGWTGEQVDHFLEIKPEEALVEFGDIYDRWQADSQAYSARGQVLRDAEEAAKGNQTVADDPIPDTSTATEAVAGLKPLDAQALSEQYGNPELIEALVGPLNKTIERVNAVADDQAKSAKVVKASREDALNQSLQDWFMGAEMKGYADTYGTEIASVTDEQMDARMALIREADIMSAGAAAHGLEFTVQEAMDRALSIVAGPKKEQAIREEIRDSLKKRTMTISSSPRKNTDDEDDGPISDEELVRRTTERLRKLRSDSTT